MRSHKASKQSWPYLHGASWMGVMQEGSPVGFGLLAVSASRLCHCCGRPVNFCSCGSNPVLDPVFQGLDKARYFNLFLFFQTYDAKNLRNENRRAVDYLASQEQGKISNSHSSFCLFSISTVAADSTGCTFRVCR